MKIRLGIVVSEFNFQITYLMLKQAEEHARFLGAEIVKVLKVPGVFEIPLGVKKLLEEKDIDGVVALGAVIEGETKHDEIVAQHAARKIMDLMIEHGKPVALGISGPGETLLQAFDRVDYAKRAVEAVVKMVRRLRGEEI